MTVRPRTATWERLVRLRRLRLVRNLATVGLAVLGPVLAAATFTVLGPFDQNASTLSLRLVLLADLVYVLLLAGLVFVAIARMIAARRRIRPGRGCTCV